MANPVETWKAEKHGLDVWPDIERHAAAGTPLKQIEAADLERMKWYGFFYRKRDEPGRYMSRIRITANEMTAAQAKEIARLAYRLGHGIVDITTRANVQIQGLSIEHLPEVRRRLESVGLTAKQTGHDNIRNVFGHPFSGLMAEELIDTRDLCHQVTALFVDSREYSDLPRKMNICLNGTNEHSAHFWTQDISYLATRTDGGEILFRVLVGGTQGQNPHLAWHLPVLVAPHQVVDVTRSILDLFRAKGSREKRNAARFCFLMDAIGVEGVLAWLDEDLDFPLVTCHRRPPPSKAHDELIGWFPQADPRLWTMGLSVPLGRMAWQQLEGLGVLAERWGNGGLRTTHEQGMAVVNIPTRHRQAALTDAAALGLSIHADALDRNTMACTGSQFCNIAVTETKGHMFQLLETLRKKQVRLEGIRIHMSGCPSSCAALHGRHRLEGRARATSAGHARRIRRVSRRRHRRRRADGSHVSAGRRRRSAPHADRRSRHAILLVPQAGTDVQRLLARTAPRRQYRQGGGRRFQTADLGLRNVPLRTRRSRPTGVLSFLRGTTAILRSAGRCSRAEPDSRPRSCCGA